MILRIATIEVEVDVDPNTPDGVLKVRVGDVVEIRRGGQAVLRIVASEVISNAPYGGASAPAQPAAPALAAGVPLPQLPNAASGPNTGGGPPAQAPEPVKEGTPHHAPNGGPRPAPIQFGPSPPPPPELMAPKPRPVNTGIYLYRVAMPEADESAFPGNPVAEVMVWTTSEADALALAVQAAVLAGGSAADAHAAFTDAKAFNSRMGSVEGALDMPQPFGRVLGRKGNELMPGVGQRYIAEKAALTGKPPAGAAEATPPAAAPSPAPSAAAPPAPEPAAPAGVPGKRPSGKKPPA